MYLRDDYLLGYPQFYVFIMMSLFHVYSKVNEYCQI